MRAPELVGSAGTSKETLARQRDVLAIQSCRMHQGRAGGVGVFGGQSHFAAAAAARTSASRDCDRPSLCSLKKECAVIHRDTRRAARTVDRVLRAVEGISGRDDGATGDRSEIDRAMPVEGSVWKR